MEHCRTERAAFLVLMVTSIAISMIVPTIAQEISHPFTAEDLVSLERIGAPSASPGGAWIVFSL